MIETAVGKNAGNSRFKKRNQSQLWAVLGFVLRICVFSLCLTPLSPAISLSQAEPAAAPVCPEITSINDAIIQTPTFSPISFATRQGDDGWPLDPALQFTTTVTRVLATFNYAGMRDGLAWERVWLFGDEELSRGSGVWEAGPRGKLTIQAMLNEGSFAPGVYKLEIYGAGQLLTKGTFLVVKEDTSTQRPVHLVYTTWDGKKHRLDLLNLATNQTGLLLESAHSPAWSADAKELLFYNESGAAEGPPGLWIFNIAQGKTYPINKEISFKSVAWSPHHAHLASTLTAGAETRLVLWDLTRHRVSDGPAGADPVWSPEGLRLAYRSCDQAGWHISTVQVIGSNFDTNTLRHLTSGDDSQPAWSWNGQWVAFVRREGDNQDIYIVRADGSSLMRLTDHPAADVSPAWTPDHRLVFRSLRDGQWYIYLMNADGSDQHQLVSTGSPPEWQSDRLAVSTNVLVAEPPQPEPQLQIPAGHGLLAVSNQVNNDEMTFTIDNVEHKIGPFQLRMLPLKPGRYTWTASWPGKTGRTGIADIGLGQVAYPIVER